MENIGAGGFSVWLCLLIVSVGVVWRLLNGTCCTALHYLKAKQSVLTRLLCAWLKAALCTAGCHNSGMRGEKKVKTLAVELDFMLQVWDSFRDQREECSFLSFQHVVHPLFTISPVHSGWNSKRAWPQSVGPSLNWRRSAVGHSERCFPLSLWWSSLWRGSLGNNRLCCCGSVLQIR